MLWYRKIVLFTFAMFDWLWLVSDPDLLSTFALFDWLWLVTDPDLL